MMISNKVLLVGY